MTYGGSILPPSAGPVERALEGADAGQRPALDPVRRMMDPARAPAVALPALAWGLSVDEWDPAWSEGVMRAVIGASVDIHRKKGTIGSVRRVLAIQGFPDAIIHERFGWNFWDGALSYDGVARFEGGDHWAEYRVELQAPVTAAEAARIRRELADTAPARCHLKALDFTLVAIRYDGFATYDGTYTHGEA